jgi:hypothetical protein
MASAKRQARTPDQQLIQAMAACLRLMLEDLRAQYHHIKAEAELSYPRPPKVQEALQIPPEPIPPASLREPIIPIPPVTQPVTPRPRTVCPACSRFLMDACAGGGVFQARKHRCFAIYQ